LFFITIIIIISSLHYGLLWTIFIVFLYFCLNLWKKNQGSKKESGSSSSLVPQIPAKVWQPGVDKLEEGEELQCDPSAYNSLHAFHIGWPCL